MIKAEVVPTVAQYVEEVLGKEGFHYVSAVVANCRMLSLQLETQEEEAQGGEQGGEAEVVDAEPVDTEALILAGYLHDISTIAHGFPDHHLKSAELAVEFLQELDVPAKRIHKVEQAILIHTTALAPEQRTSASLEGRILYDADKLGRLSGLAVVTSLIEFGARYPKQAVTSETLTAVLRHIEERFVELYQSLNTEPARELAREKFGNTLAFLDGIIEHLSDATPV